MRDPREPQRTGVGGPFCHNLLHEIDAGYGHSVERGVSSPTKKSVLTRSLAGECLTLCSVNIPEGSLLSPSKTAAVCGGNVLTSQRIVDVVLKAFHACAASQGCTKYVPEVA